jgi:hypothetical protein
VPIASFGCRPYYFSNQDVVAAAPAGIVDTASAALSGGQDDTRTLIESEVT